MNRYTAWALVGVTVVLFVLAEIKSLDDSALDRLEQLQRISPNQ